MDREEKNENYKRTQREVEINHNIKKYMRLREGSLDPESVKKYGTKLKEWQMRYMLLKNVPDKPIAKTIQDG